MTIAYAVLAVLAVVFFVGSCLSLADIEEGERRDVT